MCEIYADYILLISWIHVLYLRSPTTVIVCYWNSPLFPTI